MKIVGRILLVVFIFLFIFGISRSRAQFFIFGNPLEGKAAPDFTLATLTKESVTMSEYREGQPAILFFWAIQCPHCREALDDLNVRAPEIQKQGFKIILVDVGESKFDVESYIKDHNVGLDVFLDEDSSVASDYSIIGVPTFFLVDKDGIVRSAEHTFPEEYQNLLKTSN